MKKKLLSTVLGLGLSASLVFPSFAAPLQGIYIGNGVDKYYSIPEFINSTTKTQEMNNAGLDYVKLFQDGKIASAADILETGSLSAAFKDYEEGDLPGAYARVDGSEITPDEEEAITIEDVTAISPTQLLLTLSDGTTTTITDFTPSPLQEGTNQVSFTFNGTECNRDVEYEAPAPAPSDTYTLGIDAQDYELTATGATNTIITATLKDPEGNPITGDGTVKFIATLGSLSQDVVELENGKATAVLTSAASATEVTSHVTATIIDSENEEYEGLTAQVDVVFVPQAVEEINIVSPVKVEAYQADRFHVTFSGDIDAEEFEAAYLAELGDNDRAVMRLDKAAEPPIIYWDPIDRKKVVGVKQKASNVLEFLLDVDNEVPTNQIEPGVWTGSDDGYLRDNITHTLNFTRDIGNLVNGSYDKKLDFIFVDALKPEICGIEDVKDQLTVSVKFSEAMAEDIVEDLEDGINPHFLIDGKDIVVNSNADQEAVNEAKANNQLIATSVEVGRFDPHTKEDTRNIVTIELDYRFALQAGTHTLQGNNVGDWAAMSSADTMVPATQTFDFNVVPDLNAPVPTLTVESPEQWRLVFNKPVVVSDTKKAFDLRLGDVYDTKLVEEDDYKLTQLDDRTFLFEFERDWTVYFDEEYSEELSFSVDGVNYHTSTVNPFTLTVNEDRVRDRLGNYTGKTVLTETLAEDITSPTVTSYEAKYGLNHHSAFDPYASRWGASVEITMSEPIQMRSRDNEICSDPITPSVTQVDINHQVPYPTFEFRKGDVTIRGLVVDLSEDDYTFTVVPMKSLTAGNWELVVRSISDDVGNTKDTPEVLQLTVPETPIVESATNILWAAFENGDDGADDKLYIKFTKEMKAEGDNGVASTTNYILNGVQIPSESTVSRGIEGVTTEWDGVTITMPTNTWDGEEVDTDIFAWWCDINNRNAFTGILHVPNNFESADGEFIGTPYEVELKDQWCLWYDLMGEAPSADSDLDAVYENEDIHCSYTDGPILEARYEDTAKYDKDEDGLVSGVDGKIDKVTINLEQYWHYGDLEDALFYVNGEQWNIGNYNFNINGLVSTGDKMILTAPEAEDQIDASGDVRVTLMDEEGNLLVNGKAAIDEAGPAIADISFTNNSDKVIITFSEPVDDGTVAASDFTVEGPQGTVVIDSINTNTGPFEDDNTWEIILTNTVGLQPGEELKVKINAAKLIEDLQENSNEQTYYVSYKQEK